MNDQEIVECCCSRQIKRNKKGWDHVGGMGIRCWPNAQHDTPAYRYMAEPVEHISDTPHSGGTGVSEHKERLDDEYVAAVAAGLDAARPHDPGRPEYEYVGPAESLGLLQRCECGALVMLADTSKHNQFHAILNDAAKELGKARSFRLTGKRSPEHHFAAPTQEQTP